MSNTESANHDLTRNDPGQQGRRPPSQSPPDVYRERIEALNAKSAAWSEARRVQRERMKERRAGR